MERIQPRAGQESVWDYPRPPRLEPSPRRVVVEFAGLTIVDTLDAWRVLETSHPPVYYVPINEVADTALVPVPGSTFCEYKGLASYYDLSVAGRVSKKAGWTYPTPTSGYEPLAGLIAFYPSRVDAAYVDGELVTAQDGDFYGGWITDDVVGPFKGAPGTRWW